VEANIGAAYEEDHYRLDVAEPGAYVIETGGSTNIRIAVYGPDSKTRLVASNDDSGRDGYNARISTLLMAGRYFVRVRHQEDGTGAYWIAVSKG
jgi:Bacterial pre-peptidase C-terminal domain